MKGGDGENGTESEADSSAYFRRNTNRLTKEEMKQRLESEKRWKAKSEGSATNMVRFSCEERV